MNVAVIGGGLAGSLAALVLRSRGMRAIIVDGGRRHLGGRLSGGVNPDSGAQFLRSSDSESQWAAVLCQLSEASMVAPWDGRFGLLGARGGFLHREHLGSMSGSLGQMLRDERPQESNDVDFCGFLAGRAEHALHVGIPSNGTLCDAISNAAGAEVLGSTIVKDARWLPSAGDHGKWHLVAEGAGATDLDGRGFDALVVASHDASLAAGIVRSLGTDELAPNTAHRAVLDRLAADLQTQRDTRTLPCFSWSGYFPEGMSSRVPLDAAVAPSSRIISFVRQPRQDRPRVHPTVPTRCPQTADARLMRACVRACAGRARRLEAGTAYHSRSCLLRGWRTWRAMDRSLDHRVCTRRPRERCQR